MLKWVFGADTSPFRKSLNQMRGDVKKFSDTAKGQIASVFGAGALTAWASAALDAAGRIDDLSKRLNMSAESFQRLSYASKMSGGDMEVVGRGLTILAKNLAEAESGSKDLSNEARVLGLNLSELKGMNPEGQMVELARGYQDSADKGAALAAIMKLLGKSGAEMIPMLKEGPGSLAAMMDEAAVATNEEVAQMAALGDAMDALKMKSVAALGQIITGLKIWKAYGEWFINNFFDQMTGQKLSDDILEGRLDDIRGIGKNQATPSASGESVDKDAEKEAEKAADKRKKLVDEIANLEEEARIRALNLTEKILDAEKRRAEVAAESLFSDDETKRLEAQKRMLEIEKEIEGLRREQAGESKRLADEKQSAAERNAQDLITLAEESAQLDRDNKFNSLNEAGQLDMLRKERDKAREDERAATKRGDSKGALEAGNRGKALTGEIDGMMRGIAEEARGELKSLQSSGPTIATSSLAQIGGGGGARMIENDYQKKIANLLEIIADNTAGGSEGGKPPAPI